MSPAIRTLAAAAAAFLAQRHVGEDRTLRIVAAITVGLAAYLVLPVIVGAKPSLSGGRKVEYIEESCGCG